MCRLRVQHDTGKLVYVGSSIRRLLPILITCTEGVGCPHWDVCPEC